LNAESGSGKIFYAHMLWLRSRGGSVPRRTGYSPGRREGHYAVRGSLSAVSPFQPVKGGT